MVEINEQVAEIAGAFAADGSLQKAHLCMWGNIHQDQEYYDNVLANLYSEVFGIKLRLHPKPSNSVYGFYVCKPAIIKFFHKELGFPYGSKTYTVEVPKAIIERPELYSAFIRGFADNDGCIHFDKPRDSYPRIFLSSTSYKIIDQMSDMLKHLGLESPSYIKSHARKQKVRAKIITIQGREKLELWMKYIGFNNPVHSSKISVWKRFGTCPSWSTLIERKMALETKDINFIKKMGAK